MAAPWLPSVLQFTPSGRGFNQERMKYLMAPRGDSC